MSKRKYSENIIICGIYKITSPSGKIYIGQSIDIYYRWSDYKKIRCKEQERLYNSFKKYGPENHKFEIICECDEHQLNYFERYLIRFYDTFDTIHGLNLTEGGDSGGKKSEETRKKLSEKLSGKNNPMYGKKAWNKGISRTPKEKESISFGVNEANKKNGKRILTEDHKNNISKSNKGVSRNKGSKFSEEHVNNLTASLKRSWIERKKKIEIEHKHEI